jgi:hypothetical protein
MIRPAKEFRPGMDADFKPWQILIAAGLILALIILPPLIDKLGDLF